MTLAMVASRCGWDNMLYRKLHYDLSKDGIRIQSSCKMCGFIYEHFRSNNQGPVPPGPSPLITTPLTAIIIAQCVCIIYKPLPSSLTFDDCCSREVNRLCWANLLYVILVDCNLSRRLRRRKFVQLPPPLTSALAAQLKTKQQRAMDIILK